MGNSRRRVCQCFVVWLRNYITHFISSITESPVSTAANGLTYSSRGLSIRFPRFIRIREDKTIMEANTPGFLADIWRKQMGSSQTGPGNDDGDLVEVLESEVEYESDEAFLS